MTKEIETLEDVRGVIAEELGMSEAQATREIEESRKAVVAAAEAASQPNYRIHGDAQLTREQASKEMRGMLLALAQGRGDPERAAKIARDLGCEFAARALAGSTIAAGGALIDGEFGAEMIPYLRNQSIVLRGQPLMLTVPSGHITFPKMTGGNTAAYSGENSSNSASNPTFGTVSLNAKTLVGLVESSRQLFDRALNAAQKVESDLVNSLSQKTDQTFLRGAGAGAAPMGMRFFAASGNVANETNVAGTSNGSTTAERLGDLMGMKRKLMDANCADRQVWFMSNRSMIAIANLTTTTGAYYFRDTLLAPTPTLLGHPVFFSGNVPDNLTAAAGSGAGADASEIYLVDMSKIMVMDTGSLLLEVSTEGGNYFTYHQVGVKAVVEHDIAPSQSGNEVAVTASVTWR